jgi:hypothetical protein
MALLKYFWCCRHFPKSWDAVSEIIIAGMIALSLRLKGFAALGPPPSLMKLLKSEKAEAEIVGHVIILGITVLGVGMISLYGVPSILSLEDMANLKNAEQTFTVLDSHASRAFLGDSPLQTTNINLGGGVLTVEPNSTSPSYITVNGGIFNFTMPMGKVEYQLGDRIVAYEGGGVWSKYPNGSVMISRPEFNYNGVTLSLPVFEINGTGSVGGKGTEVISFRKNPVVILFPIPGIIDQLTWKKQWYFNTSNNDSWSPTYYVSSGSNPIVTYGNSSTDGNPQPSIYFQIKEPNLIVQTNWTSPNFTWNNSNGTLTSASLSFDWSVSLGQEVPTDTGSSPTPSFYVLLVKPNNSISLIYPPKTFSASSPWNTTSVNIPVDNFTQNGSYQLMLASTLTTRGNAPPPIVKIMWDNPTIQLNYTVINASYANRINPVNYSQIGNVSVNITSDFYDAWADYIRSVSSTKIVSEDKTNHTVGMNLTVYPSYVGIMNSYLQTIIALRGLDGSNPTPLKNFSFKIYFSGMNKWDIGAKNGNRELMFYIDKFNNLPPVLSIGYQDTGFSHSQEMWGSLNYTVKTDAKGDYIDVDLLNKSLSLSYSDQSVMGADNSCDPGQIKNDLNNTAFSWDNILINTSNANKTQSLYDITQHYIQKMAQNGDITFNQCAPSSQHKFPTPDSTMYINYYSPGGLVYLHITDNKADVRIS